MDFYRNGSVDEDNWIEPADFIAHETMKILNSSRHYRFIITKRIMGLFALNCTEKPL